MKKIIVFGLLATSFIFADVKEPVVQEKEPVTSQLGYFSIGAGPLPLPMPLFGIGGRFQHGHCGADISLQAVTFGSGFTFLKENIDYLHYFKPKLASQFYVGCGGSFTELISHGHCDVLFSPQFLVGKQYTNKDGDVRFIQAQIEPMSVHLNRLHKKHSWGAFPAVVISYGMCF